MQIIQNALLSMSGWFVVFIGIYLIQLLTLVHATKYIVKKYHKNPVFETSTPRLTMMSMIDMFVMILIFSALIQNTKLFVVKFKPYVK